jgi:hypothetical protein
LFRIRNTCRAANEGLHALADELLAAGFMESALFTCLMTKVRPMGADLPASSAWAMALSSSL